MDQIKCEIKKWKDVMIQVFGMNIGWKKIFNSEVEYQLWCR